MAKAAGINIMPCRLIEAEGSKHFITRRFDRDEERKIHMQTLAALYPEADSYEKLMMVCRKMRLPAATFDEVFRRMVFNILANNTDDHNKNFSFLMNEQGKWSLSPAYDLTYIFNSGGYLPEQTHGLMMNGKLYGHTKEDALAFAKENGVRKPENIINEVASAISQFRIFAKKHLVEERRISAVETRLRELLERWGFFDVFKDVINIEIGDVRYENVRVEQTYKGNYHLYATVNEKERKFVISKKREEYGLLEKQGIANLDKEVLKGLIEKFMA